MHREGKSWLPNRRPSTSTSPPCLPTQRAALEKIRTSIKAAAPNAVEGFSYGLPAFLIDGKAIAGFAAAKNHCSYYPMSGSVVATMGDALAKYETSKGAVTFPSNKPLPAALVKKLVKCRMAEIAASKTTKPRATAKTKVSPDEAAEVDAFLRGLEHPLKRKSKPSARSSSASVRAISEGVKWNAPSFRTTEWFATMNLRSTKNAATRVSSRGESPQGSEDWDRDRRSRRACQVARQGPLHGHAWRRQRNCGQRKRRSSDSCADWIKFV